MNTLFQDLGALVEEVNPAKSGLPLYILLPLIVVIAVAVIMIAFTVMYFLHRKKDNLIGAF